MKCVDEVFEIDVLHERLSQADYLVIAVPLTSATEDLIDRQTFQRMKTSAYLVNVGRGAIVNEPALIEALQAGTIGGAFLDAHVVEPLPKDHPLWRAPNTTVISHDSHSSPKIGERMVELFAKNLERYVAGLPLVNQCDISRGY